MDLQHLDTPPSDAERAAVDDLLGPPESAWEGGERTGTDLRRADGGQAARGRRDLLLPALHAVNDRIGWISEGALGYICRRLTVPPAEAYGVATFYSMFSLHDRPKRVLHVCTDIACAAKGSGRVCEDLKARLGPPGHGGAAAVRNGGANGIGNGNDNGHRDAQTSPGTEAEPAEPGITWAESPCLGMCERAPAALAIEAGSPPAYAVSAPADPDVLCAPVADTATAPPVSDAATSPTTARAHGAAATTASATAGEDTATESAPSSNGHHASPASASPAAPTTTFSPDTLPSVPAEPSAHAAVPQAGDPELLLLGRIGTVDPTDLDSYRAAGGYAALRRAIALGPSGVIREVTDSGLVGRGGAAFPTGRKWAGTAQRPEAPRYLVCNADESEPGTFKDRVLMEGDPFSVIEAMTVAGFAIGAARGYLYIRGEYPLALSRLENAIARARARGLLGPDILGSGFSFDIEIRRGAGAYICGEETAIFNSIEGLRGEPRSKPPFPVERGLFGRPTAVNNVETLVNVLPVMHMGGPAYARVGTGSSTGPKLFCVSGSVGRPGVYEVPFGATLRELLDLANANANTDTDADADAETNTNADAEAPPSPRAVLLGGAAGGFLRGDELDVPLTFEGAREAGTTLGSGVVLVIDDTVDLPAVLVRIAAFFRDESCGQCVPCRVGTVRQEEALTRLSGGSGDGSDVALLREVGEAMRDASICGLGQTAWNAVESAIDRLGVFADAPPARTSLPLTTAAPSNAKEAP